MAKIKQCVFKSFSALISIVLLITAAPVSYLKVYAATLEGFKENLMAARLKYEFLSTIPADSVGTVVLEGNGLETSLAGNITLYWGDGDGNVLPDFPFICTDSFENLLSGIEIVSGGTIPYAAKTLVAEISLPDDLKFKKQAYIPAHKQNSNPDDIYSLFMISNFPKSSEKSAAESVFIDSAEQLAKIGLSPDYPLDGNYILTEDIDLSFLPEWSPIGYSGGDGEYDAQKVFSGVFDGATHTISGMSVDVAHEFAYGGLFGAVADGAVIRNLVFKNCEVGAFGGAGGFAGIVAGMASDTQISNVCVIDCTVSAGVNGKNLLCTGSIAGKARNLTITNCYSNADLKVVQTASGTGEKLCLGGMAGYLPQDFAGFINCLFNGSINSDEKGGRLYAGGMLGMCGGEAYIQNCYFNRDKVNTTQPENNGTALTYLQILQSTVNQLGFDEKYWYNSAQGAALKITAYIPKGYIGIYSAQDLARIGESQNYPLDGNYALACDISLSEYLNWTPIGDIAFTDNSGAFSGVLNGNGHTIRNMNINLNEPAQNPKQRIMLGLFAATYGAQISNIVFDNVKIEAHSPANQLYAGVIAGVAEAKGEQQTLLNNVKILNSTLEINSAYKDTACIGSFFGAVNRIYNGDFAAGAVILNCRSNAVLINGCGGAEACIGGFIGRAYETSTFKPYLTVSESVFAGSARSVAGACVGSVVGRAVMGDTNTYYVITNVYSPGGFMCSPYMDSYMPVEATNTLP